MGTDYHGTFLVRASETVVLLSVIQLLFQLSAGAGTCNKCLQIVQRNMLHN
jgi:hypothetical protein